MDDPVVAARAYRECERITREQARNFSWGIRLLPEEKRTALSAVYAVARRIDDIGDGPLPAAQKLRLLAVARAGATAPAEHPGDLVLVALADAARRLPIPLEAFGDLVDGCEMDVGGGPTTPWRTSSTTAGTSRARSVACLSASSTRG